MSTLNALNYIDGQWQGAAGGAQGGKAGLRGRARDVGRDHRLGRRRLAGGKRGLAICSCRRRPGAVRPRFTCA